MARSYVQTATAVVAATSAVSATLISTMVTRKPYEFICTADCWIKQGVGAQTAAPNTAGNIFVPAKMKVELNGSNGTTLAVVQDTAAGQANLWAMTDM